MPKKPSAAHCGFTRLEGPLLERETHITAGNYRSKGLERAVQERRLRDITAGSDRSRGLEGVELERELRDIVEVGNTTT